MKIKTILLFLLITCSTFGQQVSFTMDVSEGCAPLTVNFNNTSSGWANPNNIRYEWYFDDGSNFIGKHATHTFTYPQSFRIYLSAFDNTTGAFLRYSEDIVSVFGGGKKFTMDKESVCPNETVRFEYDDFFFLAMPLSVKWDFGDGTFNNSNPRYVSHSYSLPGEYNVNLITTSSCGSDTLSKKIVVSNTVLPKFNFYFHNNEWGTSICPGRNMNFIAGWDDDLKYVWDFGDGDTSHQMNTVHSFDNIGRYIISLTATNLCGNSRTITDTLTVDTNYTFPYVNVSLWSNTNCRNDTTYFTISPGGFFTPDFTGYAWDFGDGTFSTEQYPKHVFLQPGTFYGNVRISQCAKDSIIYFSTTVNACSVGLQFRLNQNEQISIYPNPFSEEATLKISGETLVEGLVVVIYDMLGREVKEYNNLVSNEIRLERKNLSSGIYFYKVFKNKNTIGEGKIAIQ